jgi:uncharacterized protein (DUF697 family)
MSVKPIIDKPTSLATMTHKDFSTKFLKTMRKLAKKHNSQETAVPFYLELEAEFKASEKGFIFLAGKMNAWKKFAKENATKKEAVRGYCYITTDDKNWLLINVMPVAGKLKNKVKPVALALKKVVSVNKMGIEYVAGEFEDDDKRDAAIENMAEEPDAPDVPEDSEDSTEVVYDATTIDGTVAFAQAKAEFNKNLNIWKQSTFEDGSLADWLKAFVTTYKEDFAKDKSMAQWAYIVNNPFIGKVMFLDLHDELAVLQKESSVLFKDDFDNIIKIVERFIAERNPTMRQSLQLALMSQAKGLQLVYQTENEHPKRQAALAILIKELETIGDAPIKKPAVALEGIKDEQITGKTFGEKGTAGEQSASEKAQKMRDATVDERALEVAKLLKLGKASNDDKIFASVLRWVNDAGELQAKYAGATLKLYKIESNLVADISLVFGTGIRGLFLQNRLNGDDSIHAKLAAALGCFGGGWFSKMFSNEKADAMEIVRSGYTAAGLKGLLAKEDAFAKAAMSFLEKNKALLAEVNAMSAAKDKAEVLAAIEKEADSPEKEQKKAAAKAEILKVNDKYLMAILDRIDDESVLGRIDGDLLQKEVKAWADRATEEERAGAADVNNSFMRQLIIYSSSKKPNGVDKKLVAHIDRILTEPRASAEDQEAMKANAIYNELKKVAIDQGDKNAFSRWKQNKKTGEKFKAILFGDNDNSQLGLVTRFAAEIVKEGTATLATPLTATATPQQKQLFDNYTAITAPMLADTATLLAAFQDEATPAAIRQAIFEVAMAKVKGIMSFAGVHADFVDEIDETLRSNGARAAAYRALAKIAGDEKGLTNIGIGDDVIEILEGVGVGSPEFATIQGDTQMLEAIKLRVIGRTGLGKDDWTKIAKLLSLTGDLAKTEITVSNSTEAFKAARKISRAKILSPQELKDLGTKQAAAKKQPSYWAERLALEYKKGILVDKIAITSMILQAKRAEAVWADVMTALKSISTKAHAAIVEILGGAGDSTANVTLLSYLKMLDDKVFIAQSTRMANLRAVIKDMSAQELIKDAFNLQEGGFMAEVKKAESDLAAAQQGTDNNAIQLATDALTQAKAGAQEKLEARIKLLDVSPAFTQLLNSALDPQYALEIKNAIRDKVVEELAADPAAAATAFGIPEEDVKMLTENVRAISLNEKELQSNTGVQWRGLTSRGVARDIATANHAKQLSRGQEKLKTIGTADPEQRQAAKAEIAEKLQISGEEKAAKINAFEERKKQYDDRVKAVVNELVSVIVKAATIPLKAIPFAPGIIEAAIKAVIINLVNKGLGGDRAGSWKTVMKDMGQDFVINAAASVITEIIPFVTSAAGTVVHELAIKANDALRRVDALRKPIEAFDKVYDFIKNIADKIEAFKEAVGNWPPVKFVTDAMDTVKTKMTEIENSLKAKGLIGEVFAEYSKEKLEALAKQVSGVETYVGEVKDKVIEELTAKAGKLGEVYKVLSGLYEKLEAATTATANLMANGKSTDGITEELKKEIEGKIKDFNKLVGGKIEDLFGKIDPKVEDAKAPTVDNSSMVQLGNNPVADIAQLQAALDAQGIPVPEFIEALSFNL